MGTITEGPCGLLIETTGWNRERIVNITTLVELIDEYGICPFCLKPFDFEEGRGGSDEQCRCDDTVAASDILWVALTCPFCQHINAPPYPLSAEMECGNCGKPM